MAAVWGGRALVQVTAVLVMTACVQMETVPLSSLPPFPVEVRTPDPSVSRPQRGHLTTVELGGTALLEGWVDSPDARLVVVSEQPAELLSVRRFERPAEAAEAGPLSPDSAFRLILRSQAAPLERVCVLAVTPGGEAVLGGSDSSLCPHS